MLEKLLLLLFVFIVFQNVNAQDSLLFLIRVDDIQSRNTTTLPRSILDFENAVMQRGGKVTWAVIPHRLIESQNLNGILSKELRESVTRGNEIVLHGYNHICPVCGSSNHEMFCTAQNSHISYVQQQSLITDGLQILFDTLNITPVSFVPPGHAQDTVTFQVLLDEGIEFLSSLGNSKDFIYKNLYNLKPNNEYTWQLTSSIYQQNLQAALQSVRTTGKTNSYYCLLLHDPFIRQGYENGIVVQWIGELLDSLNLEYGNKIKYKTVTEAAKEFKQQQTSFVYSEETLPQQFQLYPNYPNPFNPSTAIKYSIPSLRYVTLKIYDILGNEITTLVNEQKASGNYEVEWNTGTNASGVYFYKLQSAEFTSVRKMVLIR